MNQPLNWFTEVWRACSPVTVEFKIFFKAINLITSLQNLFRGRQIAQNMPDISCYCQKVIIMRHSKSSTQSWLGSKFNPMIWVPITNRLDWIVVFFIRDELALIAMPRSFISPMKCLFFTAFVEARCISARSANLLRVGPRKIGENENDKIRFIVGNAPKIWPNITWAAWHQIIGTSEPKKSRMALRIIPGWDASSVNLSYDATAWQDQCEKTTIGFWFGPQWPKPQVSANLHHHLELTCKTSQKMETLA